jgi:hypothetical protein
MHIINTNAVDVSIQAVSPELSFSASIKNGAVGAGAAVAAAGAPPASAAAAALVDAAAAGGAAPGASSAHVVGAPRANTQRKTNRDNILISAKPLFDV